MKIIDKTRELIFDELSAHWEKVIAGDHSFPLTELINRCDIQGKKVLDVGCGTGILIPQGLAARPSQWTAMDLSAKMLAVLREKFTPEIEAGQVELIHADAHDMPLPDASQDRVICHNAFPHFEDLARCLGEIHRVLTPGGLFIINHYSGREFINSIHAKNPNPILQRDLIESAETLTDKLEREGFRVLEIIDTPDNFRLIAEK